MYLAPTSQYLRIPQYDFSIISRIPQKMMEFQAYPSVHGMV